ncbi:MAG: glycosyltransferase family 39 protein [Chloroflexi bacterium]|nr:glycosyltransferase family 39 protein [Chloroflexota bacterium]
MSFLNIILIAAIIIIAIYLDWLLIKWLRKKKQGAVKINPAPKQKKEFFVYPLFSAIKQKITSLINRWKDRKTAALETEADGSSQQVSQTQKQSGVFSTMSLPIRNTILRILGFILSAVLTIVGIMFMRRQEITTGVIILVIALPLFLLAVRSIEKTPPTDEEFALLKPYLIPGLMFLATVGLTVTLIFNVTDYARTKQLDYAGTVEWLLSIFCLAFGILWVSKWKPIQPREAWEWIKANKIEFGLAATVMLAALIVRMVYLTDHPYPWSGDEASVGLDAVRTMNGSITNLFDTSWSGQPNVSFLPTAFSMIIFGKTMFAIKMVSVITGTLSILALYFLAREWFGVEIALISSAFLVAYPFHLQFSRIGVDNIFDSLMAPLVIWLIFRAARLKSLPLYLLAGITTGLTIYTYVGTRLVVAMAIGTIVYFAIRQKDYLKTNLPQLGTYLAGLFVTAAPMATFFIKRPELFMTRLGQEGIFLNGWLASQVEQTGQSALQVLLEQFSKTTLVFFAQNAGSNFLNFDRPYLTTLGAVFFLIGLAAAFRYFFEERYFILQMWFWSVMTLGGFLTLSPPANTRLLMTIPVTGLFIALGAMQISKVLLNLKFKRTWVYGLNFLLIIALSYQDLSFYFGSYWQGRFFQDASGELGMETGLELQKLGEEYDYYLFGLPRVFAEFPTTDFLTPNNPKFDLNAESIPELSLNPKRGAFFVAIPENQDLLQQVMEKFPGGTHEAIKRRMDSEVLYYAYILPPKTSNP